MSTNSNASAEATTGALTTLPTAEVSGPPRYNGVSDGAGTAGGGLSGLLHAFRRVWLLALFVSLICGATAAGLEWVFWKPEFVAAAYLRVASQQPAVLAISKDSNSQSSFEVYKHTQQELIRNRFVLNKALSDPEVKQLPIVQQQISPVEWLQGQIIVSFPGDAEILEISMRGENPEALQKLVNAVCNAYVEGVAHAELNQRLAHKTNLEKVRTETEEKLRQKRGQLNTLVDSLGTGNTQAANQKEQIALENYASMRREQINTQMAQLKAQAKLKTEKAHVANLDQETIPADAVEAQIAANPEYHAAALTVESLEQLQAKAKSVVTDEKAAVGELFSKRQQQIDAAKQKLDQIRTALKPRVEDALRKQMMAEAQHTIELAQVDLDTLVEQHEQIDKEVEKYHLESNQIGRSSVDLELMRSDIDNVQKIDKEMATEIESLGIELDSASRVEILSYADVPKVRDEKSHIRSTTTYGAVCFCVPLLGICWWDSRRKKLNSVREVTDLLHMNLVGTMPLVPLRVHRRLGDGTAGAAWKRMMVEAVDSIREMLLREARSRPIKAVVVTSAMSGEGKTTVATQLAMSFARANKRTVIVDFDMRRPATHVVLGSTSGTGISEVLRGTHSLEEIVYPTDWSNLFHVPVGQIDNQSAKLLCANKLAVENVFQFLRQQFDYIIVDSSPVLPVVDTLIIGQFADVALLSVMRDVSQTRQVLEAQNRLKQIGITLLGAVVTSKGDATYDAQQYSLN